MIKKYFRYKYINFFLDIEYMKIILGIITYNRKNYLENLLTSFFKTYNPLYDYTIIIADDGSTDGTIQFLENYDKPIKLLKNNRIFIAGQTNSILYEANNYDYDIGFMVNDDVEFIEKGWDSDYIIGSEKYKHLVYFDKRYASNSAIKVYKQYHNKKAIKKLHIISKINYYNSMGCFWTFTKDVVNKVGYFNTRDFHGSGYSHIEYTLRCCRENFNDATYLFDVENPKLKVFCTQNDNNYVSVKDNLNIKKNKTALDNTIKDKKFIYFSPF